MDDAEPAVLEGDLDQLERDFYNFPVDTEPTPVASNKEEPLMQEELGERDEDDRIEAEPKTLEQIDPALQAVAEARGSSPEDWTKMAGGEGLWVFDKEKIFNPETGERYSGGPDKESASSIEREAARQWNTEGGDRHIVVPGYTEQIEGGIRLHAFQLVLGKERADGLREVGWEWHTREILFSKDEKSETAEPEYVESPSFQFQLTEEASPEPLGVSEENVLPVMAESAGASVENSEPAQVFSQEDAPVVPLELASLQAETRPEEMPAIERSADMSTPERHIEPTTTHAVDRAPSLQSLPAIEIRENTAPESLESHPDAVQQMIVALLARDRLSPHHIPQGEHTGAEGLAQEREKPANDNFIAPLPKPETPETNAPELRFQELAVVSAPRVEVARSDIEGADIPHAENIEVPAVKNIEVQKVAAESTDARSENRESVELKDARVIPFRLERAPGQEVRAESRNAEPSLSDTRSPLEKMTFKIETPVVSREEERVMNSAYRIEEVERIAPRDLEILARSLGIPEEKMAERGTTQNNIETGRASARTSMPSNVAPTRRVVRRSGGIVLVKEAA